MFKIAISDCSPKKSESIGSISMSLNLIAVMEKQLGSVQQSVREDGNARQIDILSEMCCFFHVITASG